MENTAANQFTNDIAPLPERPQFLKVLCILTWVCCGLMLLSTLAGMAMQPSPEEQAQQIENIRNINPEMADKMEEALAAQSPSTRMMSSLITVVALALSAFGAAWMWKLKKAGFYIYIVGELLPYISFVTGGKAAMAAMASIGGGMGSAVAGGVIAVMVLLDVAFIVMYGVNLKYMKK